MPALVLLLLAAFVVRQPKITVRDRLLASHITRTIDQDTLQFPPGQAVPTDTSRLPAILASVPTQCYDAQHNRILVKRIRGEGHTDNIPIASVRFPSNWELSAACAIWLAKEIEQNLNSHGVATSHNGVLVEAVGYTDRFPSPITTTPPKNTASIAASRSSSKSSVFPDWL